MTAIEARIARVPFVCPWGCKTTVPVGEAIWPLHIGSTQSSACAECAWRFENGYPLWRGHET